MYQDIWIADQQKAGKPGSDSIKQFSDSPTLHNTNMKRCVGWVV